MSSGNPMNGRRVGDPWHPSDRTVLVALQEPARAGVVAKRLSGRRIVPTLVFTCRDLLEQVKERRYGLVVVDPELSCDHGMKCIEETRRLSTAPIVALTTNYTDEPAADMVLDPYEQAEEIGERAEALLEMSRPVALPEPIRWGALELDVRTHEARWRDHPLRLTTLQFRIMEVLALAAGAVVTTEELSRRVWGESSYDDHDRLVAHVRRIRRIIEDDPSTPKFLMRVRGKGFRLATVERTRDPDA